MALHDLVQNGLSPAPASEEVIGSASSLDSSSTTQSFDCSSPKSEQSEGGVGGPVLSLDLDHDCLTHPDVLSIMGKLEASKNTIGSLSETVKRLEEHLSEEVDKSDRIQLLEQTIFQQEKELELSKQEHELDTQTISSLRKELEAQTSSLKKKCEAANKEKENMVMRYAVSEKELLDQKKAKEGIEKKLKDALKEIETYSSKLKALTTEKTKISQQFDSKSTELSNAYKEIDKLKDDINSRDIKIKWTQNKLKSEMEAHKNCPDEIVKLQQSIAAVNEETELLKEENQSLRRELEGSEVNKNIENQLKELQAKLITEKHEKGELEGKLKGVQNKQQCVIEENNTLSFQVQSLEQDRLDLDMKLSAAKEEQEKLQAKVTDLQSKLVEMDSLRVQLKQETEKLGTMNGEIERLRKTNEELIADMGACRDREAEMLAFTQKLTAKNVQLQSEFSAVEEKACELEKEEEIQVHTLASLQDKVKHLEDELKCEQAKRQEEAKLLARQVAEKTKKSQQFEATLFETQSELNLLRNKYTTALKELQRELHLYRKKIEQFESCGGGSSASGSDSICHGSRTSSLSSLNDNSNPQFQVLDVPTQTLVERIVKLQNDCAKQTERIEFLEEHSAHLVQELQKKSKLLQNYIMREQTGALTSKTMDRNKAEVTKHGGIMASLYSSSKPADDSMSLELCLDINRKLQAVLEDTLLKNITLKENIDTLGDEIARLTQK